MADEIPASKTTRPWLTQLIGTLIAAGIGVLITVCANIHSNLEDLNRAMIRMEEQSHAEAAKTVLLQRALDADEAELRSQGNRLTALETQIRLRH